MSKEISLGSAQFGIQGYGITNSENEISEEQMISILELAAKNGIKHIDSAQAYGCAEMRLGKTIKKEMCMKITSKMLVNEEANDTETWEYNLQKSIEELNIESLECLLIHNAKQIKSKNGKKLISWLNKAKERNLINKIGLSIYDEKDIKSVNIEELDVIQVPLSIYDQRLLKNGTLNTLKQTGIEVHARSIYLQGLVVTSSEHWPKWIEERSVSKHRDLENYCKQNNMSLVEAANKFIQSISEVDRYIVGICKREQLVELIRANNKKERIAKSIISALAIDDVKVVDPRKWPS